MAKSDPARDAAWSKERERAFRVMEWADLNGAQLDAFVPDDETREVINDALLAAGDAFYALGQLEKA